MSLLKWTLAAAGAAMGVRYMSDRHRQRLSGAGDQAGDGDSGAQDGGRAAQDDRDSPSQWATPSGAIGDIGASPAGVGGLGGGPGTTARSDDLLAPDSDVAPGSSANRF